MMAQATSEDTSRDEELARRLQEEEQGTSAMLSNAYDHPTDEGHTIQPSQHQYRGADGRARVRSTFVNEAVNDQVQQTTSIPNPKLAAYGNTFLLLPCVIAVIAVFAKADAPFNCQQKHLPIFCIVVAVRMALVIWVTWVVYFNRNESPQELGCMARTSLALYRPLGTFSLVWFIVGNIWLFGTDKSECDSDIYQLSLALVVIHYIIFLLPFILLLLIIPLAYCCFPLYMRVQRLFVVRRAASLLQLVLLKSLGNACAAGASWSGSRSRAARSNSMRAFPKEYVWPK
eukprot:gb/GECG01009485.1/.p1 GENE.gb/GECG01009485.1/~~gb/GECG01009485.1/.p1  ORF type:complete len:287 (+),score=15.09 gb/GECG01009485.1/:1-861(+)